jgi:hypothetical protein
VRNTLEVVADLVASIADSLGERLDPLTVRAGTDYEPPLVRSLDDVDLSIVTLTGLDMGRCRFAGVHNLDRSRIDCRFARTPTTLRWTGRQIIAEERNWRLTRPHGDDWRRPECGPPEYAEIFYLHGEEPLGARQIAELYRMLRKAREDAKDEPGAADFYYGEMEMRRHAHVGPTRRAGAFAERTVLWLYWLTSGYGLRALRAAASLLVIVAVFAALFYAFGLRNPDGSVALLQAISGATLRSGDTELLTQAGRFLQIPLHVLGPLFFGLMLLSLRARVKR